MQHEVLGRQEVVGLALAAALLGCGGSGGDSRAQAPVAVDLGGPAAGDGGVSLRLVETPERDAAAALASIAWEVDERAASERARREARPLLVLASAAWNVAGAQLEAGVLAQPRIVRASRAAVALRIDLTDVDASREVAARFGVRATPTLLVLGPEMIVRFRAVGSGAIDADALERALIEE